MGRERVMMESDRFEAKGKGRKENRDIHNITPLLRVEVPDFKFHDQLENGVTWLDL